MLKSLGNSLKIFSLLLKKCTFFTIILIILSIISGLLPPAITLLMAKIANNFSSEGMVKGVFIACVIAIACISAANSICFVTIRFLEERIACMAEKPLKCNLLTRISQLSYRWRELELSNRMIDLACNEAITKSSLSLCVFSVVMTFSALISVISSLIIVACVNQIIPIVVLIMFICMMCLSYVGNKLYIKYQFEDAKIERRKHVAFSACLNKDIGAEMRIAHKAKWLASKWSTLYDEAARVMVRRKTIAAVFEEFEPFCITLGTLILTGVYILAFPNEGKSASEIVMVISSFVAMSSCITELTMNLDTVLENGISFGYYFDLFDESLPKSRDERDDALAPKIVIDHVSFSYDGNVDAIHDICLEINQGENIAIVGENGSGKSTLAKILQSLYTPTSGEISFISKKGTFTDYRLTSVLQNYAKYELSARENIGLGDYTKIEDDNALNFAYESICGEKLFCDLNTSLGARFSSRSEESVIGRELSGGQWQRLALARAFLRDAPLVIMDEPNASIDPIAEASMIHNMFNMAKNKTCIFITHRLTTTALADRIIVLKAGQICEQGTHEELMKQNGEYVKMYNTQALMYN